MKKTILLFFLSALLSACATPTPTNTATSQPTLTIDQPTNTKVVLSTPTPIILTGCVNTSSLRVRSAPGTQSDILGGLTKGTCVSIVGRDKDVGWVMVSSEELSGWVSSEYLDIEGNDTVLAITTAVDTVANVPTAKPAAVVRKTNTPRPEYIFCANTKSYVGGYVTCKIPFAYCEYQPATNGSPTFCNDAPYPRNNFTLVFWNSNRSDLGGKCLIVSGNVELYDGKPQIVVSSRSQVSYCP